MHDHDGLAATFEDHRPHLTAVAQRVLGSRGDADDAVQETWLRLSRSDSGEIENIRAWLTTVVTRLCLNCLRGRTARREDLADHRMEDPVVEPVLDRDPEAQAVLADSVGQALAVVLDELSPGERVAFVLHDVFGFPFDRIGEMLERSPATARQLASRGRRRVRGADAPASRAGRDREIVDAFFAAARAGDMARLIAVLDPDVVLRSDGGTAIAAASAVVRGAGDVAGRARMFSGRGIVRPVVVNGCAGAVVVADGRLIAVFDFVIDDGAVLGIDVLIDPQRLAMLESAAGGL